MSSMDEKLKKSIQAIVVLSGDVIASVCENNGQKIVPNYPPAVSHALNEEIHRYQSILDEMDLIVQMRLRHVKKLWEEEQERQKKQQQQQEEEEQRKQQQEEEERKQQQQQEEEQKQLELQQQLEQQQNSLNQFDIDGDKNGNEQPNPIEEEKDDDVLIINEMKSEAPNDDLVEISAEQAQRERERSQSANIEDKESSEQPQAGKEAIEGAGAPTMEANQGDLGDFEPVTAMGFDNDLEVLLTSVDENTGDNTNDADLDGLFGDNFDFVLPD